MKQAGHVLPAGSWPDAEATDRVLIDFDRRHRRRIVLGTEAGQNVLVDLPQAVRLRDGDGLVLTDGGIVRVCARPEALLEIHAHHPADLVRIAWHLGNRHLPVQLLGERIRIRADHVIADMVVGLGGHVAALEAPFDPEAGAYAGGVPHAHHHDGDDAAGSDHRHHHGGDGAGGSDHAHPPAGIHAHSHTRPHEGDRASLLGADPDTSAATGRDDHAHHHN